MPPPTLPAAAGFPPPLPAAAPFPPTLPATALPLQHQPHPGVPAHTGAAWTNPGFGGASSSIHAQWKTPEQVPAYPGIGFTRPTLSCRERMAPTILASFLTSGQDLETYVRALVAQYRTQGSGASTSTSMAAEAVNLARLAHLMI